MNKTDRFWTSVRTKVVRSNDPMKIEFHNEYTAYIKDRQTGARFSNNCFKNETQAIEWIQNSIKLLKQGKETDITKYYNN